MEIDTVIILFLSLILINLSILYPYAIVLIKLYQSEGSINRTHQPHPVSQTTPSVTGLFYIPIKYWGYL